MSSGRIATIAQGTRLGPYEIQGLIGAGGMGEVYRAADARLGRAVAVKVLPESLAADKDRLRRFEQEARAAGQLNHPNILAIHDLGTADGVPYIVTELLDGHDVRQMLGHGPIPPRKAIDYAVQTANGLSAAHAKGILHRDLKPENVFVTSDGRVKILDFGLAKLVSRPEGPGAAGPGTAGAADETGPQVSATMTGTIMGTASYMSPEQIRQQPVDHRTDIFSLGCILHEMLAGKRAFEGETAMDRMTAILHSEPPAPPKAVEDAFPGIGMVVRRCLEKRAEDRFESACEVAFSLGLVTERGGARTVADAPDVVAPSAPSATYAVSLKRLTYREGSIRSARFAPDGQSVCYCALWEGRPMELFWALPGNPESRSLGFAEAEILSISSTGEMAVSLKRRHRGGFIYEGMLARMPLGGGAPRQVQEGIQEASWSPDGRQLAVIREAAGLMRIEYPIGKALYQTTGWPSSIRVSPDGKLVAFLDHPQGGNDAGSVAVVDLDGKVRMLSTGWSSTQGLAWAPDGREVWFSAFRTEAARCLFAVSLEGNLRPVFQTPGPMILQDISRNGDVLLVHGNERLRMQYVGPGETKPRDLSWLDWSLVRDISPDGRSLLFDESGVGGGEFHSVYMREIDGAPAVRLGDGVNPRISPDGHWALTSLDDVNRALVLLPTGAGETRTIPTGRLTCHHATWFPDGKCACVAASEGTGGLRLYEIDLESGSSRAMSEEGVSTYDLLVSPDGKFVSARSPQGKFTLYPVEGGAPRVLESIHAQERSIGWSADGRWLYVYPRGVVPASVHRIDAATGERELVREISPSDPTGVDGITVVRMSRDATAFAYSYPQGLGDLYVIEGLR